MIQYKIWLILIISCLLTSVVRCQITTSEDHLNLQLREALRLKLNGKSMEAEALFRSIADSSDLPALLQPATEAFIQLADLAISDGRLELAGQYITKSGDLISKIRIPNKSVIYQYNFLKGSLLLNQGKFNASINQFKELYEYAGNSDSLRGNLNKSIGRAYWHLNAFDSAYRLYMLNLDVYQRLSDPVKLAHTYDDIGMLLGKSGYLDSAETFFLRANQIYIANKVSKQILGSSYNYLGVVNLLAHKNAEARRYLEKSLEVRLQILEKDHPQLADVYSNLGLVYHHLNEFSRARDYHQKALDIRKIRYGENHWVIAKSLNNIGLTYMRQNEYKKANQFFYRAYAIKQTTYGDIHLETIKTQMNLGLCHLYVSNLDSATIYLMRTASQLNHFPEETTVRTNIRFNLTELQYLKGDYKTALSSAKDLIAYCKTEFGVLSPQLSGAYRFAGDILTQKTEYSNALAFYDSAISLNNHQSEQGFLLNLSETFGSYRGKSLCFMKMFNNDDDIQHLEESVEYLLKADSCSQEFYTHLNLEDQLSIGEKEVSFNETAIGASYILYHTKRDSASREVLFHFLNRKNSRLANELLRKQSLYYDDHDTLSSYESQLLEKISRIQSKLLTTETGKRVELQSSLFETKRQLEQLKAHLKEHKKAYYKAKYNTNSFTSQALQNKLRENEIILQYAFCDSSVYIASIDQNSFTITKKVLSPEFAQSLNSTLLILSNPNFLDFNVEMERFLRTTGVLYENLLQPVGDLIRGKQLIIVPDESLFKLPFEVLTNPKTSTVNHINYLIHDYAISYCTSLGSFCDTRSNQRKPNTGIGIFALSFENTGDDTGLPPIPNTIRESNAIKEFFDEAEIATNATATEALFWDRVRDFNVLHLATHALVDTADPFLSKIFLTKAVSDSLHDGFLYGFEFIGRELNQSLVFLSTCRSGNSRILPGEGMISLASGFLLSGVHNVIMSLWNISDESSARIVTSFYDHLNDGLPLNKSLQQAKVQYLKTHSGITAHPHFWSGFILNGNNEYPSAGTQDYWYFAGLAFVLFGAIGFFIRKNKK